MEMLSDFNKARSEYFRKHNRYAASVAITYESGVRLLEEVSMSSMLMRGDEKDIEQMLMKGDREEITAHLNEVVLYGMKLHVADLMINW